MNLRYFPNMLYWVVMLVIGISVVGCGARSGVIEVSSAEQVASARDALGEASQNIANVVSNETEKSGGSVETGDVAETVSSDIGNESQSEPPILTDILQEVLFFQGGGGGTDEIDLPNDIPILYSKAEIDSLVIQGFQPNENVVLLTYKRIEGNNDFLPKGQLFSTTNLKMDPEGKFVYSLAGLDGNRQHYAFSAIGTTSGEATSYWTDAHIGLIVNNNGSVLFGNHHGTISIGDHVTAHLERNPSGPPDRHTWIYEGGPGMIKLKFEENVIYVQWGERQDEIHTHLHGYMEIYNVLGQIIHPLVRDSVELRDNSTYRIVVLNPSGGEYTLSVDAVTTDSAPKVSDQSGPAISGILDLHSQFYGDSPGRTEFCTYESPKFAMKITDESELDFVEMFFKFDIEEKPEGEWDAYPLTDFEIDNLNRDQYWQFLIPIDTRYKGTLHTYVVARDVLGNSTTSPVSNFRIGYCSNEESAARAQERSMATSEEEVKTDSDALPEASTETSLASSDTTLIGDLSGEIANASVIEYGPVVELILTAHDDGILRLWNADGKDVIRAFAIGSSEINAAQFSPDGTQIAVAIRDEGVVKIVDAESGRIVHELAHERVYDVAFTGDGTQILSRGGEGVHVWDLSSGTLVRSVNVPGIATIHRGRNYMETANMIAMTSSIENPLRVWSLESGQEIVALSDIDSSFFSTMAGDLSSPGGLFAGAFCTEQGCQVIIWDAKTGAKLRVVAERGGVPNLVKFSSDGSLLATAWENGALQVWDVSSGELIHESRHGDSSNGGLFMLEDLAFSPDNLRIAFVAVGGTPQIQNIE